jgi:CheY-like chemotaxis protein
MPAGGTLSLSTFATRGRALRRRHPEATDGDYVSLQVRDTGFGMDADTIQRVFDPFFTSKEPGRGAGLGLAVAYGSVKSRGGFIDVESEVGKGTVFNIHLPATKAAVAAPEVSHAAIAGGSETVLLVEDEHLLLEALSALVEGEGYQVLTASDGIEALAIYKEKRASIRAVIADLGLPSLGGWELYLELREIDPAVAVILASGYVEKLEKIEMLETGVKRVLSKPYSADDVLRALREVLDEVSATTG